MELIFFFFKLPGTISIVKTIMSHPLGGSLGEYKERKGTIKWQKLLLSYFGGNVNISNIYVLKY